MANSVLKNPQGPFWPLGSSVTCNTATGRTYTVSARTAATSFTITASATPGANNACLSYLVVN